MYQTLQANKERETASKINQTSAKMPKENRIDKLSLYQALIIRNKEKMGMIYQNIRLDVTKQLLLGTEEGVQISSGITLEDYSDIDEIVLLFPAEPINGLVGQFILGFYVQSADPSTPGMFSLRRAWMVQNNGQYSVRLEIKGSAKIIFRWAYSRCPEVRQVYFELFDDPETIVEGQVFHQILFPAQSLKPQNVKSKLDWITVKIGLPPILIDISQDIDHCEMLLEALDKKLTANSGQYLQWSESLVKLDTIESVATEEENRLLKKSETFHVIVELKKKEIIRHKKVLPMVKHPITMIYKDGTKGAALIGCSIHEY